MLYAQLLRVCFAASVQKRAESGPGEGGGRSVDLCESDSLVRWLQHWHTVQTRVRSVGDIFCGGGVIGTGRPILRSVQ